MTLVDKPDARQRILDAAERLLAEQGLASTSLRQITAQANVNLAAVNYYFRSKEALLEAVMLRRMERVNKARLEMLEACEAKGEPPALEGVLEAFIAPTIQVACEPGGRNFVRVLARAHTEGDGTIQRLLFRHFPEVPHRFLAALRRATPELGQDDLIWSVYFSLGAIIFTLLNGPHLEEFYGHSWDPDEFARRVTSFVTAGFRAGANYETNSEKTSHVSS